MTVFGGTPLAPRGSFIPRLRGKSLDYGTKHRTHDQLFGDSRFRKGDTTETGNEHRSICAHLGGNNWPDGRGNGVGFVGDLRLARYKLPRKSGQISNFGIFGDFIPSDHDLNRCLTWLNRRITLKFVIILFLLYYIYDHKWFTLHDRSTTCLGRAESSCIRSHRSGA